jgi:hypothetical protein
VIFQEIEVYFCAQSFSLRDMDVSVSIDADRILDAKTKRRLRDKHFEVFAVPDGATNMEVRHIEKCIGRRVNFAIYTERLAKRGRFHKARHATLPGDITANDIDSALCQILSRPK